MPGETTPERAAELVSRYFEADARKDNEAILSLFADDAIVVDERRTWQGRMEIRAWRLGPVAAYEYTTTITGIDVADEKRYRASGRIDGNFPGGTAELKWDFSIVDGLVSRLEIAP